VDLGDTVRQIAVNWQHAMASHHLRFTSNVPVHNINVSGDSRAISRLLNILLDNAVKYTPSSGTIELILEAKDEFAMITVRDSGIGISDKDRHRIFERFYRADKARSRELGGAGLGLAIAEWIVAQHRGQVTVQSAPGQGSIFLVKLPIQGVEDSVVARRT
jgi:signal transduction histidine kinase